MKFTKYNNPNKRKRTKRINKNEYIIFKADFNF